MSRAARLPRCPRTRKRSFATPEDARERLWEIRAMVQKRKMPVRFYECEHCPHYHLSGNFKARDRLGTQNRSKKNQRK